MADAPYRDILDNLMDAVYFVDPDRKITFWNRAAERMTGFTAGEVIGSGCRDNLLVHVDEEGRNLCEEGCPLLKTLQDGQVRVAKVFFHHRLGHRVPVIVRCAPLVDGSGRIEGAVEIFEDASEQAAERHRLEELRRMAFLDPLTETANRRFLDLALEECFDAFRRFGSPFGVLLADLDHFKGVNDRHGHLAGDGVLRTVALTLRSNVRSFDTVGRWGGEEFLILMRNLDREALVRRSNRLRILVAASETVPPEEDEPIRVTFSGGAAVATAEDSPTSLISRADEALYESKRGGRNRITFR